MKLKRLISALLLLAMLLSCLPLSVLAVDGENYFYFSAETSETLVVPPQKIPYSADQTITDALTTAGIQLTFDPGSGFVSAINDVSGNYVYRGDFSQQESLTSAATMVNSAGDYVVSFIVARFADGKDWLQKQLQKQKAEQ